MKLLPKFARSRALTLIELLTAIALIAMLSLMLVPAGEKVKEKVQKASCIANLKALHSATGSYLLEHKSWPQIPYTQSVDKVHAKAWVEALGEYGVPHKSWICPALQEKLGAPDYTLDQFFRIDYLSTPFDSNEFTPYKWSGQPWFVEKSGIHGKGQLIIYPNGSVVELLDLVQ